VLCDRLLGICELSIHQVSCGRDRKGGKFCWYMLHFLDAANDTNGCFRSMFVALNIEYLPLKKYTQRSYQNSVQTDDFTSGKLLRLHTD